jgi:hypothetical protein
MLSLEPTSQFVCLGYEENKKVLDLGPVFRLVINTCKRND